MCYMWKQSDTKWAKQNTHVVNVNIISEIHITRQQDIKSAIHSICRGKVNVDGSCKAEATARPPMGWMKLRVMRNALR